jgi:site-specific recombinase XerD
MNRSRPFQVFMVQFCEHLKSRGMSGNTIRAYMTDLQEFERWCQREGVDPHHGPADLPASVYLNFLRNDGVAASTVNRRAVTLRRYYKMRGEVVLDDYKTPPRAPGVAHPLPDLFGDVRMMLAVSKGEARLAIALCGFAGLRVNEARTITWNDVGVEELVVLGKGGKVRRVPVAPELTAEFDRFLAENPTTPTHSNSGPIITMTDRGVRLAISRAGEKAGIDRPVASHDLRMTFGTVVYDKTKDLRVVQELLGHEDPKTTERYTGITESRKREAVKAALP